MYLTWQAQIFLLKSNLTHFCIDIYFYFCDCSMLLQKLLLQQKTLQKNKSLWPLLTWITISSAVIFFLFLGNLHNTGNNQFGSNSSNIQPTIKSFYINSWGEKIWCTLFLFIYYITQGCPASVTLGAACHTGHMSHGLHTSWAPKDPLSQPVQTPTSATAMPQSPKHYYTSSVSYISQQRTYYFP